jgi:hypothetical protein
MTCTKTISLTLIIIFVLWLLYVLFVKQNFSGIWKSLGGDSIMYFKHNRFNNTIKMYDVKQKILYSKGQVRDDVIIFENGKGTGCLVYDKISNGFSVFRIGDRNGYKDKDNEIKRGVMTPELAALIAKIEAAPEIATM